MIAVLQYSGFIVMALLLILGYKSINKRNHIIAEAINKLDTNTVLNTFFSFKSEENINGLYFNEAYTTRKLINNISSTALSEKEIDLLRNYFDLYSSEILNSLKRKISEFKQTRQPYINDFNSYEIGPFSKDTIDGHFGYKSYVYYYKLHRQEKDNPVFVNYGHYEDNSTITNNFNGVYNEFINSNSLSSEDREFIESAISKAKKEGISNDESQNLIQTIASYSDIISAADTLISLLKKFFNL